MTMYKSETEILDEAIGGDREAIQTILGQGANILNKDATAFCCYSGYDFIIRYTGTRLVDLVERICIRPSTYLPRLSLFKNEIDEILDLSRKFGKIILPIFCKGAVEIASAARIPLLVSIITKYFKVPPRLCSQKPGNGLNFYQDNYEYFNENSNFVEYLTSLDINPTHISNLEISVLLEPHILNYELVSMVDEICQKFIADRDFSSDLREADRLIKMGADIHYENGRFVRFSSLYGISEMYLFSVKRGADWRGNESFAFLSSLGIDPHCISSTEELLNILNILTIHQE